MNNWHTVLNSALQQTPLRPNMTYWAAQQCTHPFDPERAYMEYIREFIDQQKRIATLPAGWFEPAAEWNKIP